MYIRQLAREQEEGFWAYVRSRGWREALCAHWVYELQVEQGVYRIWFQPMGKRRVAALQAIRWESSEQTGRLIEKNIALQALTEITLTLAQGSGEYRRAAERMPGPCDFCAHRDETGEDRPGL